VAARLSCLSIKQPAQAGVQGLLPAFKRYQVAGLAIDFDADKAFSAAQPAAGQGARQLCTQAVPADAAGQVVGQQQAVAAGI